MSVKVNVQVAQSIRHVLKKNKISAKVSSKGGYGSSVTVELMDQMPAVAVMVRKFVSAFQIGSFNGMEDIYEFDNKNNNIPQVEFVFVNSEFSGEMRQKAYEYFKEGCLTSVSDSGELLPTLLSDCHEVLINDDYIESIVHRILCSLSDTNFWYQFKKRVVV